MHRIMEYIFNMLPYMLLALPVTVLVRVAFINVRKRQHITTTAWHEVVLCLFVLFLVGLASQTVIPKLEIWHEWHQRDRRGASGRDQPDSVQGVCRHME